MPLTRARLALFLITLVASGCGSSGVGPENPNAPIGSLTHRAIGDSREHVDAWMRPEAKNEDLLYASDRDRKKLFVVSLSTGERVGTFSFSNEPWGLCSDRAGDVFVTRSANRSQHAVVTEYPHGGTVPIAQLQVSPGITSCAIDPATGDLAVSSNPPDAPALIAVYSAPFDGPPNRTIAAGITNLSLYLAYGDAGNLYFATRSETYGLRLFEVAKNSSVPVQIENVDVDSNVIAGWHGRDLVFGVDGSGSNVSSARIRRHYARVTRVTTLEGTDLNFASQFCVNGSVLVAPYYNHFVDDIGIWAFPSGKKLADFGGFGERFVEGITISRALRGR